MVSPDSLEYITSMSNKNIIVLAEDKSLLNSSVNNYNVYLESFKMIECLTKKHLCTGV